ncbi:MAG: ABC transporter substrate-binding protein, partial [Haliea sp.]
LFIMPERVANTPASEPITDMTGSGPFIFKRDEWRQGYKVVYEKNRHYIPRDEPADGLAGGKVVKVDRVEWVTIPDPNITVAALANGEVDFVESPSVDLIPVLERSPNVELYVINVRGQSGWLRPNHLAEPFDHPAARQALLYIIDQEEILRALGIPKEDAWPHCASYFICPLPVRHEHGAHLGFTPDLNKARALLEEAGYNGGPVNILQPTDILTTSQASLVIVHQLRKAGINARAVPMDWGTLVARRAKKPSEDSEPWHLFPTIATSLDAGNPLTNFYISTPCPNSIPGWPCDEKLESLRQEWIRITDPARKHLLEEHITSRARLVVPYVNWGQWQARTAYNKVLKGVQPSLVPVFWNIEKKES